MNCQDRLLLSRLCLLALTALLFSGASSSCDGDGGTASPEWSSLPPISLLSGSQASVLLDAYVSDPDTSDADLTFLLFGGSSSTVWGGVESTTHELTLTAAGAFVGSVNLELEVSDPEGNSASQLFTVTVTSSGGTSSIEILTPSEGATCKNPVTFTAAGSSDVTLARYTSVYNGKTWTIGESTDAGGNFPLTYTFSDLGVRTVSVDGYTAAGMRVATDSVTLTVSAPPSVTITAPTDGAAVSSTVTFKASVTGEVVKVAWYSPWNGVTYLLGESDASGSQFAVTYTFSNAGAREIEARGLDASGGVVATDSIQIVVSGSSSGSDSQLGAWLWYIEGTGYTHSQLADRLASLGVKRLIVKVADGTNLWPEATDKTIPDTYQARGIAVFGWSYNYPNNNAAQADALYEAARAGYDGYVLDIESEFDGQQSTLHSLLGAFVDARDDASLAGYIPSNGWPLYATTWGNPSDHGMHVEIIDDYVDAHMPQTYLEVWGAPYMADPSYWVDYGTDEYRSLGATKPIHHIVSTEYDLITASQIDEFFATSGSESSIWRVPGTETPMSIWDTWEEVDWHMFDVDLAGIQFITPTSGGTYSPTITFKVTASSAVKKVTYTADGGYSLGESTNASSNFSLTFTFNTYGNRSVTAAGYDSAGTKLGSSSVSFTVQGSSSGAVIQGVPYYFQYNNTINPSGSCQNTSLAMLLSFYGCKVTPDTISAAWGTSYAQTPSGLATVFNSYASSCAIAQRLTAHMDGVPDDVNDLIAAGKPVIVHGYFTSYGHVLILLGFDGSSYWANDPAGRWTEQFKGGYYSSDADDGKYIAYDEAPVVQAIYTLDGVTPYPVWYHEVKP